MEENTIIDIKNKWYKLQDDECKLRVDNANKIFGDEHNSILKSANKLSEAEREKTSFIEKLKLNEYQKLLNPEGQDKLMTLDEFCNSNTDICNKIIFEKLVNSKYAHKYKFKLDGESVFWFAQQKPYTYLSIIPIYCPDTNSIILEHNLVLSDEAVIKLKLKCEYTKGTFKGTHIEFPIIKK